jgi:hypothetical protein
MAGGRHDEPSMEELLGSIQRIIAESQIAPPGAPDMKPAAAPVFVLIDDELDDFELPAMFRKEKESASARDVGFVERLTQALRAEPTSVPDAFAPLPAFAQVAPDRTSIGTSTKVSDTAHGEGAENALSAWTASESDSGFEFGPLADAAPVSTAGSGETRRVMAPCKDTLIARMGQPADTPSLQVKPQKSSAHMSEAEDVY